MISLPNLTEETILRLFRADLERRLKALQKSMEPAGTLSFSISDSPSLGIALMLAYIRGDAPWSKRLSESVQRLDTLVNGAGFFSLVSNVDPRRLDEHLHEHDGCNLVAILLRAVLARRWIENGNRASFTDLALISGYSVSGCTKAFGKKPPSANEALEWLKKIRSRS